MRINDYDHRQLMTVSVIAEENVRYTELNCIYHGNFCRPIMVQPQPTPIDGISPRQESLQFA